MYVCVCNALSDREVKRVIATGRVRTADDVYAALGCTPQCGACQDEVVEMLNGGVGASASHACASALI
jgi:Bacterioferritin-associated ferredoxin